MVKSILFKIYITTFEYIRDFPKDTSTIQDICILLLNIRMTFQKMHKHKN